MFNDKKKEKNQPEDLVRTSESFCPTCVVRICQVFHLRFVPGSFRRYFYRRSKNLGKYRESA